MPDAPELPEANDRFEKTIALTIAIIAVVLSFVGSKGDNAKTDAVVKTNQVANQWSFFQSKSLKENLASSNAMLLSQVTAQDPAAAKAKAEEMMKEAARYEAEKQEIMAKAKALEDEVKYALSIDDRCGLSSLLLQISVVVCSIAILVRWKAIFVVGAAVGLIGVVVGATAFAL